MKYHTTEECGFPRKAFPLKYNEHHLELLHNDAHALTDYRMQVHLTLYCPKCDESNTIRGRMPSDIENPSEYLKIMKLAVFGPFVSIKCPEDNKYY